MKVRFKSMYSKMNWQLVLNPAIAVDDYIKKWTITVGWLFWSIEFEFKKTEK